MTEKLTLSRRQLLKGAGIAAVGSASALLPSGNVLAAKGKAPRWAFIVDMRRCVGCRACTVACKAEYQTPLGAFRAAVYEEIIGKYPAAERHFLPRLCNHCEGNKDDGIPPCVKDCPEYPKDRRKFKTSDGKTIRYRGGATYKRPDGMIMFDNQYCTGCGKCINACPYGARNFDKSLVSGKDSTKNGITKCSFCQHRVDKGVVPACVNICPNDARIFGDLNDPGSQVSKLVADFGLLNKRKQSTLLDAENTMPMVFYIDPDNVLAKLTIAKKKFVENEAWLDVIP